MKPEVKFMVIYRHRSKYPINAMCKCLDVSRSGYYCYVNRMDKPERDEELAEMIRECQEQTKLTYGYRRVQIWLDRNGIHRNPKTILRVMNKYGLLSVVRRRKYCHYQNVLHKYPNVLNRDFQADRPNQKWVTDISYIKTAQGFLYLSVIRDLYDNSIVSYKMSTNPNVNLVLETCAQRNPCSLFRLRSTATKDFNTHLTRCITGGCVFTRQSGISEWTN